MALLDTLDPVLDPWPGCPVTSVALLLPDDVLGLGLRFRPILTAQAYLEVVSW